jgi:hypothetical protein
MKIFQCQQCSQPIFFENTLCGSCGSSLGYLEEQNDLSALVEKDGGWTALANPGEVYRFCDNRAHSVCNWLIPSGETRNLCKACRMNHTIPNLENAAHFAAWRHLEFAKHRLIYSLLRLDLPLSSKGKSPDTGLAFDFLSEDPLEPDKRVRTGHEQGLITINIAEADPAYRELARAQMGEPYRTVIGHFRHEIGHYYWERLVQMDEHQLGGFRELFGDERGDYAEALKSYYASGPPSNWGTGFISAYSTSHPWEDWAETWAHYMHLVDTLETAFAFGLRLKPDLKDLELLNMTADIDPYSHPDFDAVVAACLPLIFAVNSLNRSMGQPDLYPFVLPPPVIHKLRFIHQLCQSSREGRNA